MKAKIYVTPRQDVLDPQGEAVRHALETLGYREARDVRVGKYIEVELEEGDRVRAEGRVREMCEKLLANTLIEDYRFEIVA
jgi:phosphoribosylformylglycinamidine synthase